MAARTRAVARLPFPDAGRIKGSALPGWASKNPETALELVYQVLANQEVLLQIAGEWGADPSPPSKVIQEMKDEAAYIHLLHQLREIPGWLKELPDARAEFLGDVLTDVLGRPEVVERLAEVLRRGH